MASRRSRVSLDVSALRQPANPEEQTSILASSDYETPYASVCRERMSDQSGNQELFSPQRRSSRHHNIFSSYSHKIGALVARSNMSGKDPKAVAAKKASGGAPSPTSASQDISLPVTQSILPSNQLKDLCLKLLTQRMESQAAMREKTANRLRIMRFRRGLAMKFKAAVTSVAFASVIVKERLARLTQELDSFKCDPYTVMPGLLLNMSETAGRQLCHFRLQLNPNGILTESDDDTCRFIIDRTPLNSNGSQEEWRVWLVSADDVALCDEHFEEKGNLCVTGTWNEELKTFAPDEVMTLQPMIGPHYHIIRDFEENIRKSITANNVLSPQAESDFYQLLEIFSVALPRYDELIVLPGEVRDAIRKLSVEIMRRFLYPRLLLRLAKLRRRKLIKQTFMVPMTSDQIKSIKSIFASWPPSLLQEVAAELQPLVVEAGEIIIHEEENAGSGVFFLVSGTVDVLKKTSTTSKSLGPANTKLIATMGPPTVFGEFAFLTEDPRMATVKASTHCVLWQMTKHTFHRLFPQLPKSIMAEILNIGFKKRTANMLNTYPLTPEVLQSYTLFSKCSETMLKNVIPAIRPFAVPKGAVICKEDEPAKVIFFLRRGKCGVYRYVRERREDVHILSLRPPAVIADDAVIFNSANQTSIKAMTNCDLYILPKDDFENIMASQPKQMDIIVAAANENRQQQLNQSQYRYKEMAVGLPIVRDLLPLAKRVELMKLFVPVVYHPRQVICSKAHFADRVVIVVEGSVKFEGDMPWELGEATGFTCIVPHRWQLGAVAITNAKVIEITVEQYRDYLSRHGVLQEMIGLVRALLFPKAAASDALYRAILWTQHLRNPPMYPVSNSKTVNPHEPGFGLQVMRYKDQRVPIEERFRKQNSPTRHNRSYQQHIIDQVKELTVTESMSRIEQRFDERTAPSRWQLKPRRDGERSRTGTGTTLVFREKPPDPRRRSVDDHPILQKYKANPLAKINIRRPSSAMD